MKLFLSSKISSQKTEDVVQQYLFGKTSSRNRLSLANQINDSVKSVKNCEYLKVCLLPSERVCHLDIITFKALF